MSALNSPTVRRAETAAALAVVGELSASDVGRARRRWNDGRLAPIPRPLTRCFAASVFRPRSEKPCEPAERLTLREGRVELVAGYWQSPKARASRVTTQDAWKLSRLSDSVRAKNEASPYAYSTFSSLSVRHSPYRAGADPARGRTLTLPVRLPYAVRQTRTGCPRGGARC